MIAYLLIGSLIAGAHFAWQEPKLKKPDALELMPPTWELGAFCVLIVLPGWPIYLMMLLGARAFKEISRRLSDD